MILDIDHRFIFLLSTVYCVQSGEGTETVIKCVLKKRKTICERLKQKSVCEFVVVVIFVSL